MINQGPHDLHFLQENDRFVLTKAQASSQRQNQVRYRPTVVPSDFVGSLPIISTNNGLHGVEERLIT